MLRAEWRGHHHCPIAAAGVRACRGIGRRDGVVEVSGWHQVVGGGARAAGHQDDVATAAGGSRVVRAMVVPIVEAKWLEEARRKRRKDRRERNGEAGGRTGSRACADACADARACACACAATASAQINSRKGARASRSRRRPPRRGRQRLARRGSGIRGRRGGWQRGRRMGRISRIWAATRGVDGCGFLDACAQRTHRAQGHWVWLAS